MTFTPPATAATLDAEYVSRIQGRSGLEYFLEPFSGAMRARRRRPEGA